MEIMAIDPGTEESAFILIASRPRITIKRMGIIPNEEIFHLLKNWKPEHDSQKLLIEDMESFGMRVGKEVFQTVRWTGRFDTYWRFTHAHQISFYPAIYIYRSTVKLEICQSRRAKDSNVRAALIDLWGPVGTKKAPGLIYGVKKDIWSALALATTYMMQQDPTLPEKLDKLKMGLI